VTGASWRACLPGLAGGRGRCCHRRRRWEILAGRAAGAAPFPSHVTVTRPMISVTSEPWPHSAWSWAPVG